MSSNNESTSYLVLSDGSLEDPYLIASVPSSGVYTIYNNGQPANNGDEVKEENLRKA
jgi:hypothetical protein